MLHRCLECFDLYVTSNYLYVCNVCGNEQRKRLDLREADCVLEWVTVMSMAHHGKERVREARWRIG